MTAMIVGAIAEANDQLAEELKLAIQTLAAEYRVPTEFISRVGDPVSMIVQITHEQHADALIVGASQASHPSRASLDGDSRHPTMSLPRDRCAVRPPTRTTPRAR